RIAEERRVGEGIRDQLVGEPLLLRDAVQVRGVPQLLHLGGERLHQMRMRMAKRRDSDAASEIEVARPVGGIEIGAFSPLESEIGARVGRHGLRVHGTFPPEKPQSMGSAAKRVNGLGRAVAAKYQAGQLSNLK